MTIRNLLMVLTLAAGAAQAQTYGQPVKEVEKEARLSVSATCSITWTAGNDNTSRNCLLFTVPAGKRLAIRSFSAWCAGNTGNNFTRPWLTSFVDNGTGTVSEATLLGFEDDPGFADFEVQRWISQPVFQHATAGTQVRFYTQLTGPSSNVSSPGCSVRMQGFLLDAN